MRSVGARGCGRRASPAPGRSDAANLQRLLEELEDVPDAARQARYQCVIACVRSATMPRPLIASGTWEGRIVRVPAGSGGFGYDPVFVPAGEMRTAAQLLARPQERPSVTAPRRCRRSSRDLRTKAILPLHEARPAVRDHRPFGRR